MAPTRHTPNSTFKKVIVVRLDHKARSGYLDPAQLGHADSAELLTVDGERLAIPLTEIKSIHFVREFDQPIEPSRKTFLSRPRQEGLWLRLRFTDGDQIEGLVPNDLLGLLDRGIQITPPDSVGNTLRLFIPRAALAELRVLGVVGASRRGRPAVVPAASQGDLFTR
ncbi:MAG: hypothetical protein KGL59_16055 [Acidobacteriota bacterium]|nr:hypothetical protein [Acidobacteriota bacterium]